MDGVVMQTRQSNVRNYVISVAILIAIFLAVVLFRKWGSSDMASNQVVPAADVPPAGNFGKPVSISIVSPAQGEKVKVINGKFSCKGEIRISPGGDQPNMMLVMVEITKKELNLQVIHDRKQQMFQTFDEAGVGRFEFDYSDFGLSGDFVMKAKLIPIGSAGKGVVEASKVLDSKPVKVKFVQVK
jgi:hypothetical protein